MKTPVVAPFVSFLAVALTFLSAQPLRDNVPLRHWPAPLYWQPNLADVRPLATAPADPNPLTFIAMTPLRRCGHANWKWLYRSVWASVAGRRHGQNFPHAVYQHMLNSYDCLGVFVEFYGGATGTFGLYMHMADRTEPAVGIDS